MLAFLLSLGTAPAQVAGGLSALETKYKTDKDALTTARDQAVAAAQKTYEAALEDGEQKYSLAGKTDEVQAILGEKKRLAEGKLPPVAPPTLPKTLNPARGTYQRDIEKTERDYTTRLKQVGGDYLRALGAIEATARQNKQDTLVQQIAILKQELLGGSAPTVKGKPGPEPTVANGPSAMVNADFSQTGADGVPTGWHHVGQGSCKAVTEGGMTFLRVTSEADKPQSAIRQDFDRAPAAKEIVVSVKIRCPEMKGKGKFGIDLNQRTETDLVNEQDPFPATTEEVKNWKQYGGVVKLDPRATKIVFRMFLVGAMGNVDYKDLHVSFR